MSLINHPCYNDYLHDKIGRIHLPVAPKCNIYCNYCNRGLDQGTNMPGKTEKIMSPQEAEKTISRLLKNHRGLKIVGVAGPGDPLANEETFIVLERLKKKYPLLVYCLCTNGLLLPKMSKRISELELGFVSVTINAVEPRIGSKIYNYIKPNGKKITGIKAAKILIDSQLQGLRALHKQGIISKVNTVYIPGINSNHMQDIAKKASENGATLMNIMPLIPANKFKELPKPDCNTLNEVRSECNKLIQQFSSCNQCRADCLFIPENETKCWDIK